MGTILEAVEGKLRSVAVEVSHKQLFSSYFYEESRRSIKSWQV